MKRLLFWLRIFALGVPLMLLIAEYEAKPEVIRSADGVTEGVISLGGAPQLPLKIAGAKVLWEDIDSRVKRLERSERRRDFIGKLFDTPFKAQTIMGCAITAWLLQILSFAWDERQKKLQKIP